MSLLPVQARELLSGYRGDQLRPAGALAESIRLLTEPLRPVPEDVSDAEGAALQPLASSVLCVANDETDSGDDVLVVGADVMGFQCALLAKRFGTVTVYASDIRDRPLEPAAANGVVPTDATETDPVAVVHEATGGLGVDVVIEAVDGDQTHAIKKDDSLAQAFRVVRRGGTVLQVGHISGRVEMTPRLARLNTVRWENPREGLRVRYLPWVCCRPQQNRWCRFSRDDVALETATRTRQTHACMRKIP